MEQQNIQQGQSILKKYARQPKIYLKLPSGGKFYSSNPLEKSGSGELPIYSMTAKDELLIKTPDALLNGEATTSMIKNCCPLIDNPWEIPQIDVDAIIVAIRIATYGEKMTAAFKVPNVDEELETEVDLRTVIDQMQGHTYESNLTIGDLTFQIVPLTYKQQTELYQQTLETQRIAQVLGDTTLNEDQKIKVFQDGFKKLSATRLAGVAQQIVAISTPEGDVVDRKEISEFINDLDVETFEAITKHAEKQRTPFETQPQKVSIPKTYQDKGAPPEVEVPIMFDQSNFFVSR